MSRGILNAHSMQTMKVKNKFSPLVFSAIFVTIGIVGFIMYIASITPCNEIFFSIPHQILDFAPYYIITDQGPLYPSQTYYYRNEGPWVGNFTLIYVDKNGALILVRYPSTSPSDRKICKGYIPRVTDM